MENSQQQILSEIRFLMASVRSQLEELDAKIALWQQLVDPVEEAAIELDFDKSKYAFHSTEPSVDGIEDMPAEEQPAEEQPAESTVEPELSVESTPESEPETESVSDPQQEPAVEAVDDDLPFFDVPEEVPAADQVTEQSANPKPVVIDLMTQKYAWRTAVPGAPVKDVRGAIALMDRVLFINSLFGTDPIAFQEALTQINQMQTLDEAVNYLSTAHPEWDFDSDVVYSFMMAVRRKVN